MITVTFTANNLFALRDDIVKFLEDAGFEAQKQSVSPERDLPFDVRTPNATTSAAIAAADRGEMTTFDSVDDLLVDLNTVTATEVAEPAPLAPAPIVEEQAPIPEETRTEQPTASVSDASPPLTFEEVRLATLQLASKRGREAVMEVLAPYNVKRSSEVSEDLWPELIAKLEAAQNV